MKNSLQISLTVVALAVATLTVGAYKKESRINKSKTCSKEMCNQSKKQQSGSTSIHESFLPISM